MRRFLALMLGWATSSISFAGSALPWVGNGDEPVRLNMSDGTVYSLRLFDDVMGAFYDPRQHRVGEVTYVAVFQVSASNPGRPVGYCGTGNETWMYVYAVAGDALAAQRRVLVSSCLRSVSMASQNTGDGAQETDFSSVQWRPEGFTIDWFNNVDAIGRPLKTSHYVLPGVGAGLPRDSDPTVSSHRGASPLLPGG